MGVDYACNVIISVSDFYKDDLDSLLKNLQEYAEKERDSALGKKFKESDLWSCCFTNLKVRLLEENEFTYSANPKEETSDYKKILISYDALDWTDEILLWRCIADQYLEKYFFYFIYLYDDRGFVTNISDLAGKYFKPIYNSEEETIKKDFYCLDKWFDYDDCSDIEESTYDEDYDDDDCDEDSDEHPSYVQAQVVDENYFDENNEYDFKNKIFKENIPSLEKKKEELVKKFCDKTTGVLKTSEEDFVCAVEKNYIKDFIELLETILTKLLFEKEQNVYYPIEIKANNKEETNWLINFKCKSNFGFRLDGSFGRYKSLFSYRNGEETKEYFYFNDFELDLSRYDITNEEIYNELQIVGSGNEQNQEIIKELQKQVQEIINQREIYLYKKHLVVCSSSCDFGKFEGSNNNSKASFLEREFSVDLNRSPYCFEYDNKSYWLFDINKKEEDFSKDKFKVLDKSFQTVINEYLKAIPEDKVSLFKFLTDTFAYSAMGKAFIYKNFLICDECLEERRNIYKVGEDDFFSDFYRQGAEEKCIPSIIHDNKKYYIFGAKDWKKDYSEGMPESVLLPESFKSYFCETGLKELENKTKADYDAYKEELIKSLYKKCVGFIDEENAIEEPNSGNFFKLISLERNQKLSECTGSNLYLFATDWFEDWDDDDDEETVFYFDSLEYTDEYQISLREAGKKIQYNNGKEMKTLTHYHNCDLGDWKHLAETYSCENIQKMARKLLKIDNDNEADAESSDGILKEIKSISETM